MQVTNICVPLHRCNGATDKPKNVMNQAIKMIKFTTENGATAHTVTNDGVQVTAVRVLGSKGPKPYRTEWKSNISEQRRSPEVVWRDWVDLYGPFSMYMSDIGNIQIFDENGMKL